MSPLRDGLNLVAKEYVAAQVEDDGVLLLSEFAGAHQALDEAVTINPYSPEGFAEAIHQSLSMTAVERGRRMRSLRSVVTEHDLDDWVAELLTATVPDGEEFTVEGKDV